MKRAIRQGELWQWYTIYMPHIHDTRLSHLTDEMVTESQIE